MNEELQKQANKESASVEQKQELLDVELKDVSGGKIHIDETRVDFTFRYSTSDSSHKIRAIIKGELMKIGVPEYIISKVSVMNADKPYMSSRTVEIRVVWEQRWAEPIVTYTLY